MENICALSMAPANQMFGEYTVWECDTDSVEQSKDSCVTFSCDEVEKLHKAYLQSWSSLHLSGPEGMLIFRSLGAHANRKLASAMKSGSRSCSKVLGTDAEKKCKALIDTVESLADEKEGWWYYTKYIGGTAAGLLGVWAVFGPGIRKYNEWEDKRAYDKVTNDESNIVALDIPEAKEIAPLAIVAATIYAGYECAKAAAVWTAGAAISLASILTPIFVWEDLAKDRDDMRS